MSKIMVMYCDPDGLPRAWGVHSDEGEARGEAKRQLILYRNKKRLLDDPLADAEYAEEVHEVEDDD